MKKSAYLILRGLFMIFYLSEHTSNIESRLLTAVNQQRVPACLEVALNEVREGSIVEQIVLDALVPAVCLFFEPLDLNRIH